MKLDKLIKYLKNFSNKKNPDSEKRIFFDVLGSNIPGYIYCVVLFTTTMNKLGYRIDYQIGKNQEELVRLYSFNAVKFYIVSKYSLLKYLPKIILLNIMKFPSFFSMNKLFNMYIDGIYVGDLIYDDFNRREEQPSLRRINLKYLKIMCMNILH